MHPMCAGVPYLGHLIVEYWVDSVGNHQDGIALWAGYERSRL